MLPYLTYSLFNAYPNVKCATFTRHGGVSKAPFDCLNTGFGTGDDPIHIKENLSRIYATFGVQSAYSSTQVHGKRCIEVTAQNYLEPPQEGDILLTAQPNCPLLTRHGDCQVALFYDPVTHVIAAAHAGWRGNVLKVYQETISQMQQRYHCLPHNILVALSPSLGPHAAEFKNYQTSLPPAFLSYQVKPLYFDLWAIAHDELLSAGILPHHIEIARICTYTSPDFFSYRRSRITGRNATLITLQ